MSWACVTAVTLGLAGCDLADPGEPPSSVTPTVSATTPTSVTLRWAAATAAASPLTYEVQRGRFVVAKTEELEYTDESLAANTEYRYRVRAVDANGVAGPWSEPVPAQTAHCSEPPAGYAAYFPLDEGRTWHYTYSRTRTWVSFGSSAGTWIQKWTGEVSWTLQSASCASEGANFVLTETFDGYFTEDRLVGGDTLRTDEGPRSWEKTLHSQVRDNQLHIPGYVHLPPGSEVNPVQDRRIELEWAYEDSEPDEITSGETLWVGFHTWVRSGATLVRDAGFRTWWYTYDAGSPSPSSDSRRLTLVE